MDEILGKDFKGVVDADHFEFLKNGAVVLDSKPLDSTDPELDLVLAYRGLSYHDPYVTWVRRKEDGACFFGNYTANLETAIQDYNERS